MFIFVIPTEFFSTETNSKMDFVAWVFKREIVILHLPYQQNENEEQSGKMYGKSFKRVLNHTGKHFALGKAMIQKILMMVEKSKF